MDDPITRVNAALEGRYRVESELGEGGMAKVYLADDPLPAQPVACLQDEPIVGRRVPHLTKISAESEVAQ
jgi:hypothetical protein